MSLCLRWVSSSLGPTAPFPVTCWLWFLISGPRYEEACSTPTHLLIPRIWSSFWKRSWECCHTQILKLQGCGITDEIYVMLFWETSGLWFSQCHSSVMCYAVATSWKFSEAPCVDSSWAHFVSSTLDFRSFSGFWSQIKAVAPRLPHSHFCVISSKFLFMVVGTIIL